jgi:hypothetical protein
LQVSWILGFLWNRCPLRQEWEGTSCGFEPRVTGSLPSLMLAQRFQKKYGFEYGLFRRTGNTTYHGSAQDLFKEVSTHNQANVGRSKIVLLSICEKMKR